ncbi:baseplate J/gp47 family protein [Halomonas ramblicola]|uniref:baseplate J/gp47 family protein n=1 Tax=Halomonas ramblicola TaxID=747349 RepID=UPI0025B2E3DD|nr:baseplate J/gp47 family protein [Halomonas ramblicola]MDN3522554.1 baseplate J/gp47 family protein [Halomonas ramblicola]
MSTEDAGRKGVDYMARDYDSLLRAMREQIPRKLPEWTEYESEADFGNVLLQLFAHMGDILSYYQDRVANESFLGTARERRSVIHHLALIGYRLATAAPAAAEVTLRFPADRTEVVTLHRGDAFATRSQKDSSSVRFEYLGEDRPIDTGSLPLDPDTGDKRLRIQVEEGRRIDGDVLGVSDGSPNQRFPLGHAPLILRSIGESARVNPDLTLEVELGGVRDTGWRLQETLAFSLADQKDFTVRIDENERATLIFGDGDFGAIVPAGATLRATYRVGGGVKGNVGPGRIETLVDAPELALVGATVTNEAVATGGAERESIDHAVAHAPEVFRSLKRSVTGNDYEALARNFPGVGKVRAEAGNWNTVNLFIAPQGGGYLSDVLKANLRAYFEDKRPLSTLIEFHDVDYVSVFVTAEVHLQGYYSQTEKHDEIRTAAGALIAFDNVDFGRPLYLSKFYEAIEAIEGVAFVTITEFRRIGHDGLSEATLGKLEFAEYELPRAPVEAPYRGGVKIAVSGGY